MSQEYSASLVILLMSVLKLLKVDIAESEVTAIVTGLLALWVAIRRFNKGDINIFGARV